MGSRLTRVAVLADNWFLRLTNDQTCMIFKLEYTVQFVQTIVKMFPYLFIIRLIEILCHGTFDFQNGGRPSLVQIAGFQALHTVQRTIDHFMVCLYSWLGFCCDCMFLQNLSLTVRLNQIKHYIFKNSWLGDFPLVTHGVVLYVSLKFAIR